MAHVLANPLVNGSHEVREAPTIRILRSPSPVESNHRQAFRGDGRSTNASLGSVHLSKVSKAAGKRNGPLRRLNLSQKISSDGLLISLDVMQQNYPRIRRTVKLRAEAKGYSRLSLPYLRTQSGRYLRIPLNEQSDQNQNGMLLAVSQLEEQNFFYREIAVISSSGISLLS